MLNATEFINMVAFPDQGSHLRCPEVYRLFKMYCKRQGVNPPTRAEFYDNLKENGLSYSSSSVGRKLIGYRVRKRNDWVSLVFGIN